MTAPTPAAPAPSQIRHPWRAVVRTVFQLAIGLAAALPTLVVLAGLPTSAGLAGALGIAAALTRFMAIPAVDAAIQEWLPWLAAEPTSGRRDE